ncbi:MAG: MBL fold metallo-hydrolase [Candidatus Bilamarchaeaceae archaeon]
MVEITCYGGINEIGGNKFLVESKKTRIFLDFGQSFTLLDEYFVPEAYLYPRERFGLRDYFAFDLLPQLKGLYSKEAIERTSLPFSPPEYDGVLISHAHIDHIEHLKYLHPEIPIYLGEATKLIIDSTQVTSFNGVSYIKQDTPTITFRTGKDFSIGDFNIKPIHVDHSIPGAYGFIIETPEGNIVYSGDLRKHGPRADMTEDFLKKAAECDPILFIIEGTRVAEKEKRKNHSEGFVQQESLRIAQEKKGLILAMRYPKDIDRFRTFYKVAKETGKELVITQKTAHLLLSLKNDPVGLPNPYNDKTIKIYKREKKVYQPWENQITTNCVDSEYISKNKNNIILELEFSQLPELIDIKPDGGACIHSMSEPFEEDPLSQISEEVLRRWAKKFNLDYYQLHASGHASMGEIFQFIEQVNPERVLPVHTTGAHLFKCENVLLPLKGQTISLD